MVPAAVLTGPLKVFLSKSSKKPKNNERNGVSADIYDETVQKLNALELDSECIGGGRIQHDPLEKKIKVYGYSQGFGKADHEVSVEILKEVYGDYEITWSDEGY
nr:14 kDa phosphohistidine phosphatase-like [Halyomorpha halys]